jgi:molecular chaperone HtpG
MQDSSLVRKLNRVVTKRFLKFLDGEAKDDADKYREFYSKFGRFLKEGVVVDYEHREGLSKLLRFESSMTDPGIFTGFEDYLTRAKDGQDKIYYLTGTDRASVEAGPYLEALKSRGLEVIYFLDNIDEYLLQHLRDFDGKELVSAASSELELDDDDSIVLEGEPLAESEMEALCEYLKSELGEQVDKVAAGKRLVSSPAAVLSTDDGMSAQMRNMMRAMNPDGALPPQKVQLELNPRHALIHALAGARESNPELAKLVAGQLLDNALLSAGMLEDRVSLISRGFELMEKALKKSAE